MTIMTIIENTILKRTYLLNHGTRCPFCDAVEIIGHNGDFGVDATQSITCPSCGAKWIDVYKLDDIVVTHKPDNKPHPSVRDIMCQRIRESLYNQIEWIDNDLGILERKFEKLVPHLVDEAFSVAGISDKEQQEPWGK